LFYISVLKAKISLWFNCVQMILAIIKWFREYNDKSCIK
jgi:hypothetical protein